MEYKDKNIIREHQRFKEWVLKVYRHQWHTLSDTILLEALKEYNSKYKTNLKKFWS